MKHSIPILYCVVLAALSPSCRPHLEGDWNGTQMFIDVDGEIVSSQEIPYEECYPAVDSETLELDDTDVICVERSFSISMTDKQSSVFEADNSETEGQIISLRVSYIAGGEYAFSNGSDFVFNCVVDDVELDCDFTTTGGYLRDHHMLFERLADEEEQ